MTVLEANINNNTLNRTSAKDASYSHGRAAKVWRMNALKDVQLNLLRKMKSSNLGTKKVEDFLNDLRMDKANCEGPFYKGKQVKEGG